MSDILGPANAPFSVTDRPADSRTFSTADTFFKDCTSPDADDGTDIQAGWLNGIAAALRSLARANGLLADATTKVVPEVGTDDDLLTKAVQQLFQRAQVTYAVDTGTKNNLVVSLSPAVREYKAGVKVRVKVLVANDGACVININGLGNRNIKHPDGTALSTGDLVVGGIAELNDDGTQFQLLASHTDRTGGGGTGYRTPYAVATGTDVAIVATYTPTTASPVAGDLFLVKLIADIAGATTFNHDAHGAYDLVDPNGAPLTLKYAMSGDVLLLMYDGAKMRVLSKTSALAAGPSLMTPGAIGSLGMVRNTLDPSCAIALPESLWIASGYGPAKNLVYGAYVGDVYGGWAHSGSSFTGIWRVLSQLNNESDGGVSGLFRLSLAQRIA